MSNLGPHTGLQVLDLDSDLAGSYATMMLADTGAHVTRINLGVSEIKYNDPLFNLWNRGKNVIMADPTSSEDLQSILKLARGSDVVVNTYRPNTEFNEVIKVESLNLKQNKIVYCVISPFGEVGPLANISSDEGVVTAHAGLYGDQGGWEQQPVFIHLPVVSYGAAFLAVTGIGSALLSSDKREAGVKLNISLYDSAIAMSCGSAVSAKNVTPWIRYAKDQKGANPVYRLYRCSDGEWIFIACGNETFWNKLCIALDQLDWVYDARFDGAPWNLKLDNREVLIDLIQEIIASSDSAHWLEHFERYDVPSIIASTKASFVNHPQAKANDLFELKSQNIRTIGLPVRFHSTPGRVGDPPVNVAFKDVCSKHDKDQAQSTNILQDKVDIKQHGPLKGVKIVDLTGYISGSYGASILACLGADVIKVESPTGDGFRALGGSFQAWNRGKRGMVVDLKIAQGRKVLYDLIARSDVVMENYRPGVSNTLHVDYETLTRINSDLIYFSLTGFGSSGPMIEKAAFDPLIQAMSGAMNEQSGNVNDPVFLKLAISDYASAILTSFGVLSALLEKRNSGKGQKVETSLLNGAVAVQAGEFQMFFDQSFNNRKWSMDGTAATYRLYKTLDGYIFLSCKDNKSFKQTCGALGLNRLSQIYPNGMRRETGDYAIAQEFGKVISKFKTAKIIDILRAVGVACSESRHNIEIHSDPHAVETGLSIKSETFIGSIEQMGTPFIFNSKRITDVRSAPDFGEHSSEVLKELGYSNADIDKLRNAGAII